MTVATLNQDVWLDSAIGLTAFEVIVFQSAELSVRRATGQRTVLWDSSMRQVLFGPHTPERLNAMSVLNPLLMLS